MVINTPKIKQQPSSVTPRARHPMQNLQKDYHLQITYKDDTASQPPCGNLP